MSIPAPLRTAIRLGLAIVVIGTVTAACSLLGSDNANGGLGGTSWTVMSIDGAPTLVDARPTMTFEFDGKLSGSGGCNGYTGTFRTEEDRITIGQLTSTMMGCEADRMAQEGAFGAALEASTNWRLTEQGTLELVGPDIIVAEPAAPPGTAEPG